MLSHIRGLSKDANDGAISKTASVRKVHIIANPISGGGQGLQIAGAVADLAKAHRLPVKVSLTQYAGHAGEFIQDMLPSEDRLIIACGGDGTVSELINAAYKRADAGKFLSSSTFAVLPTGTGNGLLASLSALGSRVRDPVALMAEAIRNVDYAMRHAARDVDHAATRDRALTEAAGLDILRVKLSDGTTRHGAQAVVYGSGANFCLWSEIKLRGYPFREELSTAIVLAEGKLSFLGHVEYVDAATGIKHRLEGPFSNVVCCNVSHMATDCHMIPTSRPDDGCISLVVMEASSRLEAITMFFKAADAKHLSVPWIRTYRASHVRIVPGEDWDALSLDGEIVKCGPTDIELLPTQTKILRAKKQ